MSRTMRTTLTNFTPKSNCQKNWLNLKSSKMKIRMMNTEKSSATKNTNQTRIPPLKNPFFKEQPTTSKK